MLHLKRACCGLLLIERGMLHLERASCGLWLIERGMRVKNDDRSKFSNLSNWKEEARDLRVAGASSTTAVQK